MKRKRAVKNIGKKNKQNNKSSGEKDFDKIRHEIYKFGLSGLDKKEQLDARVELAIKLGAKPKKWAKIDADLSSEGKEKRAKLLNQQKGVQNGKARKAN